MLPNYKRILETIFVLFWIMIPFDLAFAGIDLPYSNSFSNCPDWNITENGDPPDCIGIQQSGGWTCLGGGGTGDTITSDANFTSGGGGKGIRHYKGDGINNVSGGFQTVFNSTQQELWVRFYKRYSNGFKWSSLEDEKWMWIDNGSNFKARIPGWQYNYVRFWNQDNVTNEVVNGTSNQGWDFVHGNAPNNGLSLSDGSWHCYEVHVKYGASGEEDIWIDGVNVLHKTNVDMQNDVGGWRRIIFSVNQKTPNNGSCVAVDIDEIAISNTGRIGCPWSQPPPSPTLPATPTGLKLIQ